jgi:uncharacterized protein involved in propanediol utilization
MNSLILFGLKRKLVISCPVEGFLELHSTATEGEKDKYWARKSNFLANLISNKEFKIKKRNYV